MYSGLREAGLRAAFAIKQPAEESAPQSEEGAPYDNDRRRTESAAETLGTEIVQSASFLNEEGKATKIFPARERILQNKLSLSSFLSLEILISKHLLSTNDQHIGTIFWSVYNLMHLMLVSDFKVIWQPRK